MVWALESLGLKSFNFGELSTYFPEALSPHIAAKELLAPLQSCAVAAISPDSDFDLMEKLVKVNPNLKVIRFKKSWQSWRKSKFNTQVRTLPRLEKIALLASLLCHWLPYRVFLWHDSTEKGPSFQHPSITTQVLEYCDSYLRTVVVSRSWHHRMVAELLRHRAFSRNVLARHGRQHRDIAHEFGDLGRSSATAEGGSAVNESWNQVFAGLAGNRTLYGTMVQFFSTLVPLERQLEFDFASHGWYELCQFLELPLPAGNVPFPRLRVGGGTYFDVRLQVHPVQTIAFLFLILGSLALNWLFCWWAVTISWRQLERSHASSAMSSTSKQVTPRTTATV